MTRTLTIVLFGCLNACSAGGGAPAGHCPATTGEVRQELNRLRCLTALARASRVQRLRLRGTIEEGFREVYRRLLREPLLRDSLAAWLELYRISTWHYPSERTIGAGDGIPITFVNAHHFSLPFWVRHSLQRPLGALLHFDTHSDMEAIPRPGDVEAAVRDLRAGERTAHAWHVIAHAVYRNSMPVSGAVFAAGVRNVVWVKPPWARSPAEFTGRTFAYARIKGLADPRPLAMLERQGPAALSAAYRAQISDYLQLFYDPAENKGRIIPRREGELTAWDYVPPSKRPVDKHFDHVHRFRFSNLTSHDFARRPSELLTAMPERQFVLDIDLDYFVNIGSTAPGTDDPASFGQVTVNRNEPISTVEGLFQRERVRAASMVAERVVIRRRLDDFRGVLVALRKAGKRPSLISVADSAHLPFAMRPQGEEHAAFVPGPYAYWLHREVVKIVEEIFGGKGGGRSREGTKAPPRESTRAVARRRAPPLYPPGHPVASRIQDLIRDALVAALSWANAEAAASTMEPYLSSYLLLIDAVARHGPDPGSRRIAAAVGRFHADATLNPEVLGPPFGPGGLPVAESLRRILFARRYGSVEAPVALAGARWLAKSLGMSKPPVLDRESAPLTPAEAIRRLGFGRVVVGLPASKRADLLLGIQSSDGGFGAPTMPPRARAVLSLLAVRGLLGLLATAQRMTPLPAAALWKGWPVTAAKIDEAILRGTVFASATLGTEPEADDAADALRLMHTVARLRANDAARLLADVVGPLVAGRMAGRVLAAIPSASSLGQLAELAELVEAMAFFGIDVDELRRGLSQAYAGLTLERGSGEGELSALGRFVASADVLARLGVASDARLGDLVARALRRTGRMRVAKQAQTTVDRLGALASVLRAASRGKPALTRSQFRNEWRFLEEVTEPILAAGQADLVAALLQARRLLGEDERSIRLRDLVWQMLYSQNVDGSWGRQDLFAEPLSTTRAVISALGEPHETGVAPPPGTREPSPRQP